MQKLTDENMAEIRRAMDAWNAMSEEQRSAALKAAGTASPAHAMRNLGFKIPAVLPFDDGFFRRL